MGRHYHTLPFSPGADFVWNRRVMHEGAETNVGERVNKDAFSELRLRQMYEMRMITFAPFGDAKPPSFLNNGKGNADKLARELAKEEAASAKAKGKGAHEPRSAPKPTPAKRADAKKPAPAPASSGPP